MPRIQVNANAGQPVELHYEDHGTGQPVVLIHGATRPSSTPACSTS